MWPIGKCFGPRLVGLRKQGQKSASLRMSRLVRQLTMADPLARTSPELATVVKVSWGSRALSLDYGSSSIRC